MEITTETGARLYWQGSRGRWSVSVPIPEAEHRHRYCDGPEHRGTLFETARLRVLARSAGDGRAVFRLAGPNIRQDGNPGARTLACEISREDGARDYPVAWQAVQEALTGLAAAIRENAVLACEEITRARSVTMQVTTGDST
jgi:hypothetical protein